MLSSPLLSVKQTLANTLISLVQEFFNTTYDTSVLQASKVLAHGDYATPCAMWLAKEVKQPPLAIAAKIICELEKSSAFKQWVKSIELVKPGFINFHLNAAAKQHVITEVLMAGASYGHKPSHGTKVIVEFVSANPTGPLHVGHARQAVLGDAMSHLLKSQGYDVHREYYYNDAGAQIEVLAKSTLLRAQGFKPGDACWPLDPLNPQSKSFYNGEYIQDIADDFLAKKSVLSNGVLVSASGDCTDIDSIRAFAVAYLRNEQIKDLNSFDVHFDNYYLESSLYTSHRVAETVEKLTANGATFEDEGCLWLNTTQWGDDKNRVMKKQDGAYTYFVPDVAYHLTKWERGFTKALNIQGSDHHGTINRVRAGLQALGAGVPNGYPEYMIHTMVRVFKGDKEVKISKRAGSYVTLQDLIGWTSVDAVRFLLLSRKADTDYTFDVDLAIAQNNENPVFYVQYAYTRMQALLNKWATSAATTDLSKVDLTPLSGPASHALMQHLAEYPEMLECAALENTPHDVTFYLRQLSSLYHSYYDAERILVDHEPTKLARLALVAAALQVLKNGFSILGVSAKMLSPSHK